MKKLNRKAVGLLFLAAIVIVAGTAALVPRIRVAMLVHRLHGADDVPAAAAVAQRLVALNSGPAFDVLESYAESSPLVAFDRRHAVLLIHDGATGSTHVVRPQVEWREIRPSSRPRDGKDAASAPFRISIKTTAESLTVGNPAIVMSGVVRLDSTEDRVDFALKTADDRGYYRYRLTFKDGTMNFDSSEVTKEELSNWKQRSDWPSTWE